MSDSHERRRRRDRIPGHHGDAGHHAADGGGRVALDQDLAGRLVHPLDVKRILLGEVGLGVIPAGLERALVQRHGLGLLAQLPGQRLLHERHVDAEQLRQDAVVDHVLHEAAQLRVGAHRRDELVERHRIEREVGAQRVELQRLVVHDRGARHRASARLPWPSPGSSPRGSRLPSCARRSRACWPGWCTRSAARRCSTGTCSSRTPARPSTGLNEGARGWRSGCPNR